jgi:phytoene/squalene synthetase
MPVDHYENFPVASFLLPRRLVPAVEAIYAFARSADDLADEGRRHAAERLAACTPTKKRWAASSWGRPRRRDGRPVRAPAAVIAKFSCR